MKVANVWSIYISQAELSSLLYELTKVKPRLWIHFSRLYEISSLTPHCLVLLLDSIKVIRLVYYHCLKIRKKHTASAKVLLKADIIYFCDVRSAINSGWTAFTTWVGYKLLTQATPCFILFAMELLSCL